MLISWVTDEINYSTSIKWKTFLNTVKKNEVDLYILKRKDV